MSVLCDSRFFDAHSPDGAKRVKRKGQAAMSLVDIRRPSGEG